MKKIIIILTILALNFICFAQFAGGTGTVENPYQIASAEQLNQVRYYLTSSFIQTADIDLGVSPWNGGEGWDPIGDYDWTDPSKSFRGNYGGQGYKIENMYINRFNENYLGLFGSVSTSLIDNINLAGFNILSDKATIGGLIGISYDSSLMSCYADGNIQGYSQIGLLIGYFEGNSIIDCHTNGKIVAAGSYIGGLTGICYLDSINNCSAIVEINGKNLVGGLIGSLEGVERIQNCFTECNITATGGWVGGCFGGVGITTETTAYISNCFVKGQIYSDSTSTFIRERIGGFSGQFSGNEYDSTFIKVNNNYSNVEINGNDMTGGFVGKIWTFTEINNCYSKGHISGRSEVGGFIGSIEDTESVTVSNSYWDTETSGIDSSAAGEGRTTAEMTMPYGSNTYIDWDFSSVWRDDVANQNNGYPTFLWVSGIEEEDADFASLPRGFELYQNYPNPFNPITSINFALSKVSEVKLSVYNISGQVVAELVNGTKQAGQHTVDFEGSKLNSGVYYYTLQTNDKTMTKKMVLTK